MIGNLVTFANNRLQPVQNPEESRTYPVRLPGGVTLAPGTVLGQTTAAAAAAEVQTLTITGTPTGGTFTLAFNGQVTAPIAYNANAAAVQAALQALSTIGSGNVTGGGGALPGTPVTLTFAGALTNTPVPLVTVASTAFTGGTTPAAAVARTTRGVPAGGYFDAYADANTDGTQTAKAILEQGVTTQPDGTILDEFGGGLKYASAFFAGTFRCSELTGLDAAGVADLGRLISGNTAALTAATTYLRMG
jgi:hypothetical protein